MYVHYVYNRMLLSASSVAAIFLMEKTIKIVNIVAVLRWRVDIYRAHRIYQGDEAGSIFFFKDFLLNFFHCACWYALLVYFNSVSLNFLANWAFTNIYLAIPHTPFLSLSFLQCKYNLLI